MNERDGDLPDAGRRRLTAGLVALGIASVARPLSAEQTAEAATGARGLYTIEIVVFRGGGSTAGEDLAAAVRSAGADSDSGGGNARSAQLGEVLPAARRRLNDVVARLNASGSHKVIAHAAWTQTASAWGANSSLSVEELGLSAAGLAGQVQLERGLYLHLGLNLTYTAPGGVRYALSEMRRVKFGERNYFDHPALGVIALVTPGG